MPDADESTITRLLADAERPRQMTTREQAAILARVAAAAERSSGDLDRGDVVKLRPSDPARPQRRRRVAATTLGTVAAALLLLVLVIGSRGEPVDPAAEPLLPPVPTTGASAWCQREVATLASAIERWRGVEDWAFSINGVPDLIVLTDEAIAGLVEFAPTADIDQVRRQLVDTDLELSLYEDQRDVAAARSLVVTDAVAALIEIGGDVAPTCSFERLEAALKL